MTAHTIYIANTSSTCGTYVEENVTTTGCTKYIIRLDSNTTADGPFDITIVSNANVTNFTGVTIQEMVQGFTISLSCP